MTTTALILLVLITASAIYMAVRQTLPCSSVECHRSAKLVDELLRRSLEPDVGLIALVSTGDCTHYRVEYNAARVDLRATVDARAGEELAQEVLTRLRRSIIRSHILTSSDHDQALIAVQISQSQCSWEISMRRVWRGHLIRNFIDLVRALAQPAQGALR